MRAIRNIWRDFKNQDKETKRSVWFIFYFFIFILITTNPSITRRLFGEPKIKQIKKIK